MALINAQQIAEIKDVLKTVTDTFFVTPLVVSIPKMSVDRFNEDNEDEAFENYNLKCMFEIPTNKAQVDGSLQGYTQFYDIKVTLNYRDIKTANLHDGNNETKINPATAYVTVNNRRYKVTSVALDGPIEAENVLVIILAKREEKGYGDE